jgi:hypothetical protein
VIDDDFVITLDGVQLAYYAEYRAKIRRDRDDGLLQPHSCRTLESVIDLAERKGLMLATPGQPANFGGFGALPTVLVEFPHIETALAPWHRVHEALELTGATVEQYKAFKADEEQEVREEGGTSRFDSYRCHPADGPSFEVPVCNWQMVMLLMLDGPWGKEFFGNMQPAFRRAMVESGLGESLGAVVVREGVDGEFVHTGETITDAILAGGPLLSVEETHRRAQAGPLGGLHSGD